MAGARERRAIFGAFLFTLAFLPRLYVALFWAAEPVWDGHYYDFGARRIAAGLGYSDDLEIAGHLVWHPWCHYPVGYSAFLALFYRALGATPFAAAFANALVGAALALVTWRLAARALSEGRARLAGILVAVDPGLVVYAALLMTEPLAALLTLAAFWIAVRRPHAPWRGIVLGALVLGVGALVRPQALLCAPFFGLVPGDRERGPGRGPTRRRVTRAAGAAVLACAAALLPVIPWTVRNCARMDGCALVSTNAGWNLAIGSFPRATGRFETLRASDGCREVTGQVQQDRCWFSYGVASIRRDPVRWLRLVPAKLAFTFDHESFPIEYLREARRSSWPEPRREMGRAWLTAAHRVLLASALLGCVAFVGRRGWRGGGRARREGWGQGALAVSAIALVYAAGASEPTAYWAIAVAVAVLPWLPLPGHPAWPAALRLPVALVGTTVVTHAVFFGEDRYHVVLTPVLCLLAAAALRPPARTGLVRSNEDGAQNDRGASPAMG